LRRGSAAALVFSLFIGQSPLASARDQSEEERQMRQRIEETRRKLAAEQNLPEEQRWEIDEQHIHELEDQAARGDQRATSFLELARDRMARLRRERFEKTWGRMLNHPDAAVELRVHARRAAELDRLRFLAHSRKYPALEQRAEELLKREWQRHTKRMQAIADDLKAPLVGRSEGGSP
jgi:hypothetical protein